MTNIIKFLDTEMKIIDHNGQKWLTAPDISRALGYDREQAATQIFHRHKDEFNGDLSMTLNLRFMDSKRAYPTRIFNRRGAHLIAMLAKTPRAKDFRKWVLDVLDGHVSPPKSLPQQQPSLPSPDTDYWRQEAEQWRKSCYATRDRYEAMLGRIYTRVDVLKTLFDRMNVSLPPVMLEVIGEQLTGINAVITKR